MDPIRNILVALSETDDTGYVLEKARFLAERNTAALHVVRVVDARVAGIRVSDGHSPARLESLTLASQQACFEDPVTHYRWDYARIDTATLSDVRTWRGILDAAKSVDADLIVKATNMHNRLNEIVHTPDDWQLLRNSEAPVMLVKPNAWVASPVLVAALDVYDHAQDSLNQEILTTAGRLATALEGRIHIVVAYPSFTPWPYEMGAAETYLRLQHDFKAEIATRVAALVNETGVGYDVLHPIQGHAAPAIASVTDDLESGLVVAGTHARSGVKGFFLGNTSERVLHFMNVDVVTVHAPDTVGALRDAA